MVERLNDQYPVRILLENCNIQKRKSFKPINMIVMKNFTNEQLVKELIKRRVITPATGECMMMSDIQIIEKILSEDGFYVEDQELIIVTQKILIEELTKRGLVQPVANDVYSLSITLAISNEEPPFA